MVECRRAESGKFFPSLDPELLQTGKVKVVGNPFLCQTTLAVNLHLLPGDIARVLHIKCHLSRDLRGNRAEFGSQSDQLGPFHLGPAQVLFQSCSAFQSPRQQHLFHGRNLFFLENQPRVSFRLDQAIRLAQPGQSPIGVVLSQEQSVLGATGEQPIGLVDAGGREVVNQHAEVGLVAVDHQFPALLGQGSICAGDQALTSGLFITGGAVNLAGKE